MSFGDIDPFSGWIALGAFSVAALSLLVAPSRRSRRIIGAITIIVFAGAGVMLFSATAKNSGSSAEEGPSTREQVPFLTPTPTFTSPPQSTAQPESGLDASSPTTSGAAPEPQPVRLTEIEVVPVDDTSGKIAPNTYKTSGKYDYRYRYISHSTIGDLDSNDCAVAMRITRASDGIIIGEQEQLSDCTLRGWDQQYVPPGNYVALVTVTYEGQKLDGRLPFRVISG